MSNETENIKCNYLTAFYDDQTITVYQAFNSEIALSAVQNQTFISPPFKMERMTWIKPSFLWMMYRSAWASKVNQEHILSIKINRDGFEYALEHSCLTKYDERIHYSLENWKNNLRNNPVRVQWDPDRDIFLQPRNNKAIQIGLSGKVLELYVKDWIVNITDITKECNLIHQYITENKIDYAKKMIPSETIYPLPNRILKKISMLVH